MRSVVVGLTVLTLVAPAAGSGALLRRIPMRSSLQVPGVARAMRLELDPAQLRALRAGSGARVVDGIPVGTRRLGRVRLHPVNPFGPAPRLVLGGVDGGTTLPVPDVSWFVGDVEGDPRSRVLLTAGSASVHGLVVTPSDVVRFGPDGAGRHLAWALSDVDERARRPRGDFCLNDVAAEQMSRGAALPAHGAPRDAGRATAARRVELALETDHELRTKFGSDAAALEYLGDLVVAANLIYERDAGVQLTAPFVRLWAGTDPWTATDTLGALDEVQAWWLDPTHDMAAVAGTHDAVHFVSGKGAQGGMAYLAAVCEQYWAFGVSQVFGSFDARTPDEIWDVLVFTHELGHTLGSPHTHCYDPPIDKCYSGESGCYSGPVVPTSNGTIMSYCHLNAGGLSNVQLLFGDRVSTQIRSTVAAASCLDDVQLVCGDGGVDFGEECDDGNTVAGDGCASDCRIETRCGDGRVGGDEECDDGNGLAGDGCSPDCRVEAVCGDGHVGGGEQCDDGNRLSDDGCSSSCEQEPVCGDGRVGGGEECDDGNPDAYDGCSPSCRREVCSVRDPGQVAWDPASLVVEPKGGRRRLTVTARFSVPADALADPLPQVGFLLQGADGEDLRVSDLALRPVTKGRTRGQAFAGRFDAGGAVVRLGAGSGQSRPVTVRLRYALDGAARVPGPPLTATVLLGNEETGRRGGCGMHEWRGCHRGKGGRRMRCG